ncbi:MAG: kynureninase [candidate division Zixibacteria bacterium]|nr:kynureninase [candidate division Zixibacteria bacterium]
MILPTDRAYAESLDRADELAIFRARFVIDDPSLVYLDGNSLGRLPEAARTLAREVVDRQWGSRLIRGWNDGWMELPFRIAGKIARLIGANPSEVVMADATSVNLFKLALAGARHLPNRKTLVTDALNFPSDLYILESVAALVGMSLRVVSSRDDIGVDMTDLATAIDDKTALVMLTHTVFKSGFTYDMTEVSALAHQHGALTLWDVSHSAGAIPVALNASKADLAVGCTYKYLNGGPGAPAFLFVRQGLQAQLDNPISGWFGHARPFDFATSYEAAGHIARFLTGTPPVVSLALSEPGIDLLLEAGMERLYTKSIRQSEYFIGLWETMLRSLGFTLNSPAEPHRRGSHVSLGHPEAYRIDQALIHDEGVIPDFRTPDNLRFGITPLYTTFVELHRAAEAMKKIVEERLYERYPVERAGVT